MLCRSNLAFWFCLRNISDLLDDITAKTCHFLPPARGRLWRAVLERHFPCCDVWFSRNNQTFQILLLTSRQNVETFMKAPIRLLKEVINEILIFLLGKKLLLYNLVNFFVLILKCAKISREQHYCGFFEVCSVPQLVYFIYIKSFWLSFWL